MLKNKCCLYVIISILFFSITICNLLIESPSYNSFGQIEILVEGHTVGSSDDDSETSASRIRTEFRPDSARYLSVNLYDIYHNCVYSEKLLMMDRGTVRNM